MKPTIHYAVVTEAVSMREVEELQTIVWGNSTISPTPQLVASVHNGGVVIGAYDQDKLVGFCYGFAGYKHGSVSLCSHMMGILPQYRDLNIGYQLKQQQRLWAIDYGYQKITWTFDPLETRNAFLNLCKLGGIVRTYIPSYYGEMADEVNKGLPTDRLLLEWDAMSDRTLQAAAGTLLTSEVWSGYRSLVEWVPLGSYARPVQRHAIEEEAGYLIPVPRYIHEMKKDELELAKEWRYTLREQLQEALAKGYVITGLLRSEDPVHYYVVEK
ncbi:GNAT family N-acetyltransferase [Brevibacillus sp. NRS-1366]|uniref:GNAT family N-acetyltransferase n=1 Tax=Brevibacillus sp. NRS-1366 TaxID=3233899 RepID=UPI003D246B6A